MPRQHVQDIGIGGLKLEPCRLLARKDGDPYCSDRKEDLRMIRISKTSRISADQIIDRAARFFGKDGEGLEEMERGACCIYLTGAGGHVMVQVSEQDDQRTVDVESQEFDYQAKKFLNSL
jgi:hypothetical protein